MEILRFLDPTLLPWVFVMVLVGQCLKRFTLPKWLPPMPVIIFVLAFLVSSLFGCAETNSEGWKSFVIGVLKYGIGNGMTMAMVACYGYDLIHSIAKKIGSKKEVELDEINE